MFHFQRETVRAAIIEDFTVIREETEMFNFHKKKKRQSERS